MAYVIKRYSNRKLYDTQESRYVTLEEIEEMVRGGREIAVVDASSGEDLTSVTLTQIILENERAHRSALPAAFLHQLITHGEAWQDFVQRSMRSSMEGIVSSQREMERVFREWTTRAGWGAVAGAAPADAPHGDDAGPEAAKVRDEAAEKVRDEAAEKLRDEVAEKLRDEVTTLRERLRSLEDQLKKKDEAK